MPTGRERWRQLTDSAPQPEECGQSLYYDSGVRRV